MKYRVLAGLTALILGLVSPLANAEELTIELSDLSAFDYQPEVPESSGLIKNTFSHFFPSRFLSWIKRVSRSLVT
jgi:hypothetical protein